VLEKSHYNVILYFLLTPIIPSITLGSVG